MEINVTSPVNSLGYGIVGLNIINGLKKTGHEVSWWPIGNTECPQDKVDLLKAAAQHARLYNPRAPSLRIYHQFDLSQHIGKGPHCGLPIFELTKFNDVELHHLKNQDIVFAPSHWAADVLGANGVSRERIFFSPFGVDPEIFHPAVETPPAGESPPTIFLTVGKWEVRKGHDVIEQAFNKAFTEKDNVILVMHCFNPALPKQEDSKRYNDQWTNLFKKSYLGNKINVIGGRLRTQKEVAGVMAQADCGVFPARAEGWNLDLAEMMAMGKHVIATNYSAHTEYCTAENSHLIDVDSLEDAYDGVWFHGHGQWAELGDNQVDQLVEHMRGIHKLKQAGELQPNKKGIETMRHFTWERTASEITAALVST